MTTPSFAIPCQSATWCTYSCSVHVSSHSTSNELSPVLYWYLNDFKSDWPDTECRCPSLLLVDAPAVVEAKGLFVGTRMWVMKYGYEKHEWYITCIDQDAGREWFRKSRALQIVMQVTLEDLGLPVFVQYKHYQLSVTSQSVW